MSGEAPKPKRLCGWVLDHLVHDIHGKDRTLVLKQPEKKFRVLSYEEVARRLQERKKG